MNDPISEYMAVMMSIPFQFGILNNRWTRCIDVMLEKKRNVRQIHRLQIIGLLETDFNTALKIYFARKMTTNSENTNLTDK